MRSIFTVLVLSILGLLIFIIKFRKIKIYFCYFLEFYLVDYAVIFVCLVLAHFYFDIRYNLTSILFFLLGLPQFIILAAVGLFFVRKVGFKISFNVTKFSRSKLIPLILEGFKFGIILSLTSVLVLYIERKPVINPTNPNIMFISIWFFYSMALAIIQETYFRLFLLPFLSFIMRKIKIGFVISTVITSLFSVIMFYEYIGYNIIVMIQIFIMGIILAIVMKTKGWDICIIGATSFYFINFALLGNTIFLFR